MRIMHVVGARPNFMKTAPIMAGMSAFPAEFQQVLVHTGQHYDAAMSEGFFMDLELPVPDVFLNVGSGSHAEQTARIMLAFEPVLSEHRPDWVIVVGDVNSTMAAALVAVKIGIPTAHVEAGLRSFDRTMPEEVNRLVTDQLSDLLFVSEPSGLTNLHNEGIPEDKVHFVGNVMIDALSLFRNKASQSSILKQLGLVDQAFVILTLHRPSNVDAVESFERVLRAVAEIGKRLPVVFPAHPRSRRMISEFHLDRYFLNVKNPGTPLQSKGIYLIEPLGYLDFYRLMMETRVVLTDSGGIQEETTALGKPCLTLRENTERPVTVTEGTNTLVGNSPERIVEECRLILEGKGKKGKVPEKWDGEAAQRIVDIFRKGRYAIL